MTLRLRQICLVAAKLQPAEQALQSIFGLEVCHRDPAVGPYGLENALFVFGHQFLELVAPTREGTAAGRFLDRHSAPDGTRRRGAYIAIFDTHDPERRREHVHSLGVRVAHEMQHPGFYGIQLHPRDCRAAMLEFDRSVGNEALDGAYVPAGPHWLAAQRLDRVAGMPWVDVQGPAPTELAAHWARLIDQPLQTDPRTDPGTDPAGGAPVLRFDLGGIRFLPGEHEALTTLHVAVGRPDAVRAAAQACGCAVDDTGFDLCGVRFVPRPLTSLSSDAQPLGVTGNHPG
jgi:hypothetical protein